MKLTEFKRKVAENPLPVVIDLWAPWCSPCRSISPALKKLALEYNGRVDLWKVNADESQDLLKAMRVYGIPTLLVFRDGEEVYRLTGARPMGDLKRLFEIALAQEDSSRRGPSSFDRILRLGAGLALIALGVTFSLSPLIFIVAAIIAFSAVYDRCPIWQTLAPRLKRLIAPAASRQK